MSNQNRQSRQVQGHFEIEMKVELRKLIIPVLVILELFIIIAALVMSILEITLTTEMPHTASRTYPK